MTPYWSLINVFIQHAYRVDTGVLIFSLKIILAPHRHMRSIPQGSISAPTCCQGLSTGNRKRGRRRKRRQTVLIDHDYVYDYVYVAREQREPFIQGAVAGSATSVSGSGYTRLLIDE